MHTAVRATPQDRTEIVGKSDKAKGAMRSVVERHEAISSAEQGVPGVDATNSDGTMSLTLAIHEGQLSTVKRLLAESDIDSEGWFENTPLLMAAESGHLDILQYLLFETSANYEATNRFGNNALAVAAFRGHSEAVRLLWSTIGTGIESPDVNGCTPLIAASAAGHLEIVKYLLHEAGANTKTTTNDGHGLLSVASSSGHLSVVRFLVTEVGADTGHASNTEMTPLLLASSRGHLQVLKYLLSERSSSIDDRCSSGGTCLHHAAANGRLKIIKFLHSITGVNIVAPDSQGLDPRSWTLSALSRAMRELQSGSRGASQAKVDRLKTTERYLKTLIDQ